MRSHIFGEQELNFAGNPKKQSTLAERLIPTTPFREGSVRNSFRQVFWLSDHPVLCVFP
jgi:hypothetical protein